MTSVLINRPTTSIISLCPELSEAPDSWEQLVGAIKPAPVIVSTMDTEVTVTEVTLSYSPKKKVVKVQKTPSPKTKKTSPKSKKTVHTSSKPEQTDEKLTMTLAEYQKQKVQTPVEVVNDTTLRNKKKKEKAKARKAAAKASEWVSNEKPKAKTVIRKPEHKTNRSLKNSDQNNTTLVLKNLPYTCDSSKDIQKFFRKCGPVKFVNVLKNDEGKCKGIAFVRFETHEGSDKGLDMDGFWYEDRKIYVEYAQERK